MVRADLGAYLVLTLLYYGLVVIGMAYVTFINPGLQPELLRAVGQAFTTGPLATLGDAYGGGQVLLAMLLTFLMNLLRGAGSDLPGSITALKPARAHCHGNGRTSPTQ